MTSKFEPFYSAAKELARKTGNKLLAVLAFSGHYSQRNAGKNYDVHPDEFTHYREAVRELERIADESAERLERSA